MKPVLKILKTTVLAAALAGTLALQGEVITIFEEPADLQELAITNAVNSDTVLVNAFTTPVSALDGDALRHWDFDDAGRTTLRYRPDTTVIEGIQYSFDAYIDPASSGIVLFRVGNDTATLAGVKNTGLSVAIDSNGDIVADFADPEAEGGFAKAVFEAAVTVGMRFNLTIVFNAAVEGDLRFSLGGSDLTLAPQTFAVFVDDALLGTDLAALNSVSTGDGSFNYDPSLGAQDVWWLTGGASVQAGMDLQFDNIVFKTGSDIGGGGSSSDTWGGHEIVNETGDVFAEDWIGWINVANAPYILSYSTGGWIYMPEPAANDSGAWGYFFK